MKEDTSPAVEQTQICISVVRPELHKEYIGTIQYITFTLEGSDTKGTSIIMRGFININRKTSDFELLRANLLKRWPGIFVPPLPLDPRNSPSHEELEELGGRCQQFLVDLSRREYIWYGEVRVVSTQMMQFFLKINTMSCEKVLNSFGRHDFQEILYQYRTNFKVQSSSEEEEEKVTYFIDEFDKQLAFIILAFEDIKEKGGEELLSQQNNGRSKYIKALKEFEKCSEEKGEDKTQPTKEEESMMQMIAHNQLNITLQKKQRRHILDSLLLNLQCLLSPTSHMLCGEALKKDRSQIMAFQQILHGRQELIKKREKVKQRIRLQQQKISELAEGRQSLFSKLKKISIGGQIKNHELSLQKLRAQYQDYCELSTLVDNLLILQIDRFKKKRFNSYSNLVKQLMEEEINQMKIEQQFWKKIQEGKYMALSFEELSHEQQKIEEKEGKDDLRDEV